VASFFTAEIAENAEKHIKRKGFPATKITKKKSTNLHEFPQMRSGTVEQEAES